MNEDRFLLRQLLSAARESGSHTEESGRRTTLGHPNRE
jgi:hypothetical protein